LLIVTSAVYNEENASSKAIAPVYDQLAGQLSRPGKVTFTKVSTVQQAQIAQSYNVTKYAHVHMTANAEDTGF
jgi:hypothetical protein